MGGLIEAVASGGMSLVGSAYQAHQNSKESRYNRRFQERMSNTANQRAADDLEAAGLNRVLALGQPASTPSGAQSSITAPDLGSAIDTGISASSAKQQIRQSKAATALTAAQELTEAEKKKQTEASTRLTNEQARLTSAQASEAEFKKILYDKGLPYINEVTDNLQKHITNAREDPAAVLTKVLQGGSDLPSGKAQQKHNQDIRDRRSMYIGDRIDDVKRYYSRFKNWSRNKQASTY